MKAEDQLWALGELISSLGLTLDGDIAENCMCMGCWVYTLSDIDGRVCEAETLQELIKKAVEHYNLQV